MEFIISPTLDNTKMMEDTHKRVFLYLKLRPLFKHKHTLATTKAFATPCGTPNSSISTLAL